LSQHHRQLPPALPEGAAAPEGRAPVPAGEQDPRAGGLPVRAGSPADQVSTNVIARGDGTMLKARCAAAMLALILTLTTTLTPGPAFAASGAEIERDARKGLQDLYAKNPKARELGAKAKGILVFPGIIKAGFMFGGQYGEGALFKGG